MTTDKGSDDICVSVNLQAFWRNKPKSDDGEGPTTNEGRQKSGVSEGKGRKLGNRRKCPIGGHVRGFVGEEASDERWKWSNGRQKEIDRSANEEGIDEADNNSDRAVTPNKKVKPTKEEERPEEALMTVEKPRKQKRKSGEYLSATLNGGQAAILSVGIAAVMALTGLHVAKGSMGIGNLVLANGLILQVAGPLQANEWTTDQRCSKSIIVIHCV
eukprot:Gb_30688 [translate_table: standard]